MNERQHEVDAGTRTRVHGQAARETQEQETENRFSLQRDPLTRVTARPGDASSAHTYASLLNRIMTSQPSRATHSLLQLQRTYGNHYVQRVLALARKGEGETDAAPEVEDAIQRARSGGQALDSGVRAGMEAAFGADFGRVRVHTGAEADLLNRALSARAFTTGQHIFFRESEYNPTGSGGRELLAHELTHVVQQTGGVRPKLTVSQPGDKHEQEADWAPAALATGEVANVTGMVQRCGGEAHAGCDCARGLMSEESDLVSQPLYIQRLLRSRVIQTKLTINEPGDQYEQEAERVADQVMRMAEPQALERAAISGSTSLLSIQRAGDPTAIPPGFPCPTDLTPGRPAGTDLLFPPDGFTITPAHTTLLTAFRAAWLAAGGTDDILVHGYASTDGPQGHNWTLSCNRAQAVQAELIRLGIPAIHIDILAHGESTDFGAAAAPNRHAVVSTSAAGLFSNPLVFGLLTPVDNFASRSLTRFGVGEAINLNFFSFPPRPAADFGGLEWHLVSGGGTLLLGPVPNDGTGTYTAPAVASAVTLELRVATGATAGRVVSRRAITIVIPSGVRMTEVPGTAPDFAGVILAGTWGAGFRANVFVDPRNVSFQGVVFGEGTVAAVVTPAGSFLSARAGLVHPINTFGPAHGGNATTGTPVSPPQDNIATAGGVTPSRVLGVDICGDSDFLWAIPWEFSVAGGPRTPFTIANHHVTSTLLCNATIEKGGAGPFCRRINGTTC